VTVSDAHETAGSIVSPDFAEVQRLLGGDQREELIALRQRVEQLEALLMAQEDRTEAVSEVLVGSVDGTQATRLWVRQCAR